MSQKVALISGGTLGIGKNLVSLFLKNGIKVITFSRKKSNINSLIKEFAEYKDDLICYQGDVSDPKDVKRIVSDLVRSVKYSLA